MTGPLPPWATQRAPQRAPEPNTPLDRQFAAFIGPRWETYRRKFAPFFEDPGFVPTWNWAAALTIPFGAVWFLYRKLYVPFAFFWIMPSLVLGMLWGSEVPDVSDMANASPAAQDFAVLLLGVLLSASVLAGGTANFLLYRRAQAALRVVGAQTTGEGAVPLLARVGRVNRVGVIVVLVFVLLAQVARVGFFPGK